MECTSFPLQHARGSPRLLVGDEGCYLIDDTGRRNLDLLSGLLAAQMAATVMVSSDQRVREELGSTSRPAAHVLFDSARWFVDHGCVVPKRVAKLSWSPPVGA